MPSYIRGESPEAKCLHFYVFVLNLLLSLFGGKGNAGEMGRDVSTICLSNHGSLTIL